MRALVGQGEVRGSSVVGGSARDGGAAKGAAALAAMSGTSGEGDVKFHEVLGRAAEASRSLDPYDPTCRSFYVRVDGVGFTKWSDEYCVAKPYDGDVHGAFVSAAAAGGHQPRRAPGAPRHASRRVGSRTPARAFAPTPLTTVAVTR